MPGFETAVRNGSLILTNGEIETRIMYETDIPLPPRVQVAGLVGDPTGGPVLRGIYESYVEAARSFGLPVIIGPQPSGSASITYVKPGSATPRSGGSTPTQWRCIRRSGTDRTTGRYTSPG